MDSKKLEEIREFLGAKEPINIGIFRWDPIEIITICDRVDNAKKETDDDDEAYEECVT